MRTFFTFSALLLLGCVAANLISVPTVSDLRVISPADLKVTDTLFQLDAFDRHFEIRIQRTVTKPNGLRLEEYKNVQGEDLLHLTVVNEEDGTLSGSFWIGGEMFHLQSIRPFLPQLKKIKADFDTASRQVVFRERDTREDPEVPVHCGGVDPSNSTLSSHAVQTNQKRQDSGNTYALDLPTLNCPTSLKTLTFSMALDAKFIRKAQADGLDPNNYARSIISTMSQVYVKTANVQFAVDEILLFPTENSDPVWNSPTCTDISTKLYQFSEWRGTRNANAGLWHLMTGCYSSGTVGLAWINVMCTKTTRNQGSGQWVSGTGVSSYLGSAQTWKVLAHEVGHNFGSQHTNVGIMIPSNIKDSVFSRASQEYMCNGIFSNGKCLTAGSSSCTPNCSGKTCGTDGCGGSCGTCASPSTCSSSGVCQSCQRNCNGKNCGSDGCGGSCGSCSGSSTCSSSGICSSPPADSTDGATWISLHNTERSPYGLTPMTWDTTVSSVAQRWAAGCTWSHSSGSGYGENIAAYSGDQTKNIAALFKGWADEKANWDCPNNAAINNKVVGHFTQIVWSSSTKLGCAIQYCTSGSPFGSSFPTWTFAVCNYSPPGNYIGQRPFPATSCGGVCTPSTSCSAQGKVCGTINNGCETVSCGSCGADSQCNSQGQCQCKPAGTCSGAGRECGTLFDGCNNLNCGTCASGSTCTSAGKCQVNPPTCTPFATCATKGMTCGNLWDGCKDVTCGACLTGQTCMEGVCKGCSGCSPYASCNVDKCVCKSGYEGDGLTCKAIPEVPVRGTDAWYALSGDLTSWTRLGTDLVNSATAQSAVALIDSGSRMTGDSAVTFRSKIYRSSSAVEAGIAFGKTSGFYWVFTLTDTKASLYAACGNNLCSGVYSVATGRWNAKEWLDVKVQIRNQNAVSFSVNGVAVGGTWTYGAGFLGDLGVFSKGGSASFQEVVLKTSSYLSINLVECLTPEQFSQKIALILNVSPSQVPASSVKSNCNRKRQAEATAVTYTFELLGTSEVSAPALASDLSAKVLSNHPALEANAVEAASAVEVVPASLAGAEIATITVATTAAVLSTAAIIGIAVGGGVGLAAVGGGVAAGVIVAKKKREANEVPMETTTGRRIDLLSSPEQNGFTSITARGVAQDHS